VRTGIGSLSGVVKVRFVGVGIRDALGGCSAAVGPDMAQAAAEMEGSTGLVPTALDEMGDVQLRRLFAV
jgi:hypothetical protein